MKVFILNKIVVQEIGASALNEQRPKLQQQMLVELRWLLPGHLRLVKRCLPWAHTEGTFSN